MGSTCPTAEWAGIYEFAADVQLRSALRISGSSTSRFSSDSSIRRTFGWLRMAAASGVVGLFLHHAEDGDASIQKRPDACGIRVRVPLHAADLVHQHKVAVLRALQRVHARRFKRVRERRDAKFRAADANAVLCAAEQILRGGGMQIDGSAAVRLRLCRDGAEAAQPLRLQSVQRGGDQRAFPDLHRTGQKYVHPYPSSRGFFAVPERFARCRIISAAIDTAISAGVWPRMSSPMGA